MVRFAEMGCCAFCLGCDGSDYLRVEMDYRARVLLWRAAMTSEELLEELATGEPMTVVLVNWYERIKAAEKSDDRCATQT